MSLINSEGRLITYLLLQFSQTDLVSDFLFLAMALTALGLSLAFFMGRRRKKVQKQKVNQSPEPEVTILPPTVPADTAELPAAWELLYETMGFRVVEDITYIPGKEVEKLRIRINQ